MSFASRGRPILALSVNAQRGLRDGPNEKVGLFCRERYPVPVVNRFVGDGGSQKTLNFNKTKEIDMIKITFGDNNSININDNEFDTIVEALEYMRDHDPIEDNVNKLNELLDKLTK